MAIPLRYIRNRVQGRLRNRDPRSPGWDDVDVDMEICSSYIQIAARLPAPGLYTSSAFTISAGSDLFTLPTTVTQWTGGAGGAEYEGRVDIQLVRTGDFLRYVSREEMESIKSGQQTISLGTPSQFAMYEDKSQVMQGWCDPGAASSEACNLYAPLMADDPRDFIGSGSQGMDNVSLAFSRVAGQALEYLVTAELLGRMTPEDAASRRLNQAYAGRMVRESDRLIFAEAGRRHRIRDAGRTQRWIPSEGR